MRFRTILTLATLLPTVFLPLLVGRQLASPNKQAVFTVRRRRVDLFPARFPPSEATSFSVDVQKSQEPVTLKFLIDDHTKIDGTFQVGSTGHGRLSHRRSEQFRRPRCGALGSLFVAKPATAKLRAKELYYQPSLPVLHIVDSGK